MLTVCAAGAVNVLGLLLAERPVPAFGVMLIDEFGFIVFALNVTLPVCASNVT